MGFTPKFNTFRGLFKSLALTMRIVVMFASPLVKPVYYTLSNSINDKNLGPPQPEEAWIPVRAPYELHTSASQVYAAIFNKPQQLTMFQISHANLCPKVLQSKLS